jgi:hypothetical protein
MAYTSGWKHSGQAVNWDGVSVEGPKPPAPGACELRVLKMEAQESQKGQPMISVQLEIISHTSDEESVGRKVYDNFVLTQEGAFKVKNYCLVAGVDPTEALATVDYDTVNAFAEAQLGTTVAAMLSHRTYQGKARAQIDYYGEAPPTDGANGNGNGAGREAHPARPAPKAGKSGKPAGRR